MNSEKLKLINLIKISFINLTFFLRKLRSVWYIIEQIKKKKGYRQIQHQTSRCHKAKYSARFHHILGIKYTLKYFILLFICKRVISIIALAGLHLRCGGGARPPHLGHSVTKNLN